VSGPIPWRWQTRRFAVYFAFVLAAVLAAGAFGALHDQISYTVSPEYFTKFKFVQFDLLNDAVPERVRAAQVGFLGAWWMGVPLGLLIGAAGFIHPDMPQMRRALLWSLVVAIAFTLLFALGGLVYGLIQTAAFGLAHHEGWYIPQGLVQPRRFISVGYMHNAAYTGGEIALPVAWAFHLFARRKQCRQTSVSSRSLQSVLRKKYIAPAVFLAVSASNFIGLSVMWTKATVCADIGHTCRLARIDSLLITVLSYPVQSLPDDVLRSLFGHSILSLLLINAVAWGVGTVVIMRVLLRFTGGTHTAKGQED
jgi:hypothetical protein